MDAHFRIICSKARYEVTQTELSTFVHYFKGQIADSAAEVYWKDETFMECSTHAIFQVENTHNIKAAIPAFFPISPNTIIEHRDKDFVSLEHDSSPTEPEDIFFILHISLKEDAHESISH